MFYFCIFNMLCQSSCAFLWLINFFNNFMFCLIVFVNKLFTSVFVVFYRFLSAPLPRFEQLLVHTFSFYWFSDGSWLIVILFFFCLLQLFLMLFLLSSVYIFFVMKLAGHINLHIYTCLFSSHLNLLFDFLLPFP